MSFTKLPPPFSCRRLHRPRSFQMVVCKRKFSFFAVAVVVVQLLFNFYHHDFIRLFWDFFRAVPTLVFTRPFSSPSGWRAFKHSSTRFFITSSTLAATTATAAHDLFKFYIQFFFHSVHKYYFDVRNFSSLIDFVAFVTCLSSFVFFLFLLLFSLFTFFSCCIYVLFF